eukprot:CAMPEP_0194322076 /NCGR_PEP_ID=MMETSP0171-20130528/18272_1 /TAXON_ID=218684 /ORGANISM="Corethron pennatum, Strain L29A3" /LENGTH=208 /DNA_ID=CAMNT_0039080243 /DNA_START=774 /DNA_END=1400 /DNA_ORIENTATION=+
MTPEQIIDINRRYAANIYALAGRHYEDEGGSCSWSSTPVVSGAVLKLSDDGSAVSLQFVSCAGGACARRAIDLTPDLSAAGEGARPSARSLRRLLRSAVRPRLRWFVRDRVLAICTLVFVGLWVGFLRTPPGGRSHTIFGGLLAFIVVAHAAETLYAAAICASAGFRPGLVASVAWTAAIIVTGMPCTSRILSYAEMHRGMSERTKTS